MLRSIAVICIFTAIFLISESGYTQTANQHPIFIANEETSLYSETFLGDSKTPLFLLGRDILSTSDVLGCSTEQDIDRMIQNAIENRSEQAFEPLRSNALGSTQQQPSAQSDLLGFPLTALNKPLILGGSVTHFSYSDFESENAYSRTLSQYRLRNMSIELQPKITISEAEGCFLDFMACGRDGHCITDFFDRPSVYMKIPVLGISKKHQAVLIEPTELNLQLKDKVFALRRYSLSSFLPIQFDINTSQLAFVDFSESTLIFDMIKTLGFSSEFFNATMPAPPQMTSRWFIKFGLEEESDFVSRPPTEGVEYLTTTSPLYNDTFIARRNISPDSPEHFYVKNFPDEYKELAQQSFEYWNSIYLDLAGYLAFSYQFIQGDYDGQREIITGDIRYNVIEWSNDRLPNTGSVHQIDHKTGEILSTNIIMRGFHIADEYSRWFRYSEMVRANEPVTDSIPFMNNFPFRNSPSNLVSMALIGSADAIDSSDLVRPHLQVNLLAPEGETAESYIFNALKYATTHEIGHSFGLEHNPQASIFIKNNIPYSMMDVLSPGDNYNFHYETTPNNYDKMALGYGYFGILPDRVDTSCPLNEVLDIRSGPTEAQKGKSPECFLGDATSSPIKNYADKLENILNLLLTKKDDQSLPYLIWSQPIAVLIHSLVSSIASYHFSADTHYDQLQTVSIEGRKPNSPQEVKDLVMDHLTPILCESRLSDIMHSQPENTSSHRALYNNASNFSRTFVHAVFLWTDVNRISCPDNRLIFRRRNEEPPTDPPLF